MGGNCSSQRKQKGKGPETHKLETQHAEEASVSLVLEPKGPQWEMRSWGWKEGGILGPSISVSKYRSPGRCAEGGDLTPTGM